MAGETNNHETKARIDRFPLKYLMLTMILVFLAAIFAARDTLPTWGDETFTLRIAATESWTGFRDEIKNDVHPPLYFLLAKISAGNADSQYDPSLSDNIEFLSSTTYYLLIICIFVLMLRRVSTVQSFFHSIIFLVFSAHMALFGEMYRYYALSAAGITFATMLMIPPRPDLIPFEGKKRIHNSTWYAITLWVAFASSYISFIIIPAHIIWLLKRPKNESRPFWFAMLGALIASIPPGILMIKQIYSIGGSTHPSFGGLITGAVARFAFTIYSFLLGEFIQPWDFWLTIPALFAFAYLVFLAWRIRKDPLGSLLWISLAVSLPLGVLALSWIGVGIEFSASRLFFLAPLFLILLGLGIQTAMKNRTQKLLGTGAIIILVVLNIVSNVNYKLGTNFIQSTYIIPWEQIAEDVESNYVPDTLVFYDDDTLPYYLDDSIEWKENLRVSDIANGNISRDELLDYDRIIIVYSPGDPAVEQLVQNTLNTLIPGMSLTDLINAHDYIREDETSMRWKRMLLGRQVNEVKKRLIVYNAAG